MAEELALELLCVMKTEKTREKKLAAQEEAALCERILKHPDFAGFIKEEGSTSMRFGNFKVTSNAKWGRTVVESELKEIEADIPKGLNPFKRKVVVDQTMLSKLRDANPKLYKHCCRAILEKKQKTGVTVTEVE